MDNGENLPKVRAAAPGAGGVAGPRRPKNPSDGGFSPPEAGFARPAGRPRPAGPARDPMRARHAPPHRWLTSGAEKGRAGALGDPPDGRATAQARLARSVVDQEPVAVRTGLVPERAVHAERGPGARDRFPEHGAGLGGDRVPA